MAGLVFRLMSKLLATGLMIIFLGATHLKDALNLWGWGKGSIGLFEVIERSLIGGIDNGFNKAFIFITNFSQNFAARNAGIIMMDGFVVLVLWLFLFCIVWFATDILTGKDEDPMIYPLVISIVILALGAWFFGNPEPASQVAQNVTRVVDLT